MLDLKFVRDNIDVVQTALTNRHNPLKLDKFVELEKKRRDILAEVETLKGQRNTVSKQISEMKKNKEKFLKSSSQEKSKFFVPQQ